MELHRLDLAPPQPPVAFAGDMSADRQPSFTSHYVLTFNGTCQAAQIMAETDITMPKP